MASFKQHAHDPEQLWLFPPSLDDLVPIDSEVRLIGDAVDEMDMREIEASYSHTGRPAYNPRTLIKILLFAYSKGVRSSRKIGELVECDVRFMWIARGDRPDFHTIARFRTERREQLERVFVQSVRLCARAGLVLLESVSIDGTKVQAKASRESLVSAEDLREEQLVEGILREAEAVDAAEDELYGEGNGRELPEEMRDPAKRRQRLRELLAELETDQSKQVSTTDPESRLMKTQGGLELGYNVQAAVDSSEQVVVGLDVVNRAYDTGQVLPMLDRIRENLGFSPDVVLADGGYSDEQTLKGLLERGQKALIASVRPPRQKDGDERFRAEAFKHNAETDTLVCPEGRDLTFRGEHRMGSGTYREYRTTGCHRCPSYQVCVPSGKGSRSIHISVIADIRNGMRALLRSDEGRAVYAVRKETVEPVFGNVKRNLGFNRFLLRGKAGARAEAALVFTAHNVLKWARHMQGTSEALVIPS